MDRAKAAKLAELKELKKLQASLKMSAFMEKLEGHGGCNQNQRRLLDFLAAVFRRPAEKTARRKRNHVFGFFRAVALAVGPDRRERRLRAVH